MVETSRHLARIGAVSAIVGAALLFVATSLHPMSADPSDALAAFTEYGADRLWVASHLGQFAGVVLLVVALVALASAMDDGRAAAWARIGVVGAAASLAAAAALQAVDGVALKTMVDRWAQASGEARTVAFEAAFAVRQIEVGLASLSSVTLGLTVLAYGAAIVASERFPTWLGLVGATGGFATVIAGVAQAYTGFSSLSMTISMPGALLLLVWAIMVGIQLWRLDR